MISPLSPAYRHGFLLVVLLAILLFYAHLGGAPIYILDEAKNAQCAREMFERGDWIVPTFNGKLRTDKPALHYFFMSLGYSLFGVNEWGARFFSAFFGVGTIVLIFSFTRKYLGKRIALLASLIFLSSINLSLEMHFAVPDPYLIFWISGALFFIFDYLHSNRIIFLYLFYLFIALAVLTKGPVAIALPGLILLIFLLLSRRFNWKQILRLQPLAGILIVLLVAGPWYYLVHEATQGEWTRGFFLDHNLNRFTNIKEGHGGFFLLTLAFVIVGLIPFSVYLVQAFIKTRRQFQQPILLFSWVTGICFILFFTLSRTKLPNYTMPSYPFLCILLAYYLQSPLSPKGLRIPAWILLVLVTAIPVALWFAIAQEPQIKMLQPLSLFFLLMPLTLIAGIYFLYQQKRDRYLLTLVSGFMVTALVFFYIVYPAVYNRNPVKESLPLIMGEKNIVAYKDFNPGYIFYLGRKVPVVWNRAQVDSVLRVHPKLTVLTQEEHTEELDGTGLKKMYEGKNIFELQVSKVFRREQP